ncbi:MAG: hypothetical protein AAB371_01925 [Patescibacteria group bacterium]
MWINNSADFQKFCGYFLDGIWYPRVTSIVDIKSKPALYAFYAKADSFSDAKQQLKKAANEGTAVHQLIEDFITGKDLHVSEKYIGFQKGFEEFLRQYNFFVKKEWAEKRIRHPVHRYAGTFDMVAEIDGVFALVDIKTSAAIYEDYRLQTSAYFHALNGEPWLLDSRGNKILLPKEVQKRYVLRLNQKQLCENCGAKKKLRDMGDKITGGKSACEHQFSETMEDWELKEFDNHERDFQGFLNCKGLWEWENRVFLEEIGYL